MSQVASKPDLVAVFAALLVGFSGVVPWINAPKPGPSVRSVVSDPDPPAGLLLLERFFFFLAMSDAWNGGSETSGQETPLGPHFDV